jgi:hypothetical protein
MTLIPGSEHECLESIARERKDYWARRGVADRNTVDLVNRSGYEISLEGVKAEAGFYQEVGCYLEWKRWANNYEAKQPDLLGVDVKGCRPGRGLVFKPGDAEDGKGEFPHVLVWVEGWDCVVKGWLYGHEVQDDRYWRSDWARPAWCAPARVLRPAGPLIAELRRRVLSDGD